MGRLIRLGEWLKWRESHYNHVFVVVSTGVTAENIWVVEATLKGVKLTLLSDLLASGAEIDIFRPPVECNSLKVAEFALAQLGSPYGLLSILCITLDITTPDWFIAFRRKKTWICSALASEALRYGGWLEDWDDIYITTPTMLYLRLTAKKVVKRPCTGLKS